MEIEEIFACHFCDKICPDRRIFTKHMRKHKERKFSCLLCPKRFLYRIELQRHVNIVHHGDKPKFPCDQCDAVRHSKRSLHVHCVNEHSADFRYKCEICLRGFNFKDLLLCHVKADHENHRIPCERCEKKFRNDAYYKIHLKTCHGQEQTRKLCQHCAKTFTSKQHLMRHIRKAHEGLVEDLVCEVCGKRVADLRAHLRIHSDVKQFACDICEKRFKRQEQLKMHRRVHTKERPYKCDVCGKSFTQRSPLVTHMRYHTGERPYKCDLCSKGFVTKAALKQHSCKVANYVAK